MAEFCSQFWTESVSLSHICCLLVVWDYMSTAWEEIKLAKLISWLLGILIRYSSKHNRNPSIQTSVFYASITITWQYSFAVLQSTPFINKLLINHFKLRSLPSVHPPNFELSLCITAPRKLIIPKLKMEPANASNPSWSKPGWATSTQTWNQTRGSNRKQPANLGQRCSSSSLI